MSNFVGSWRRAPIFKPRNLVTAVLATLVAVLLAIAIIALLTEPAHGQVDPLTPRPECGGKICGFGYIAPDNACACLMKNGVSVGPIGCWPLDKRWHPYCATPGNSGCALDFAAANRRWHYQCRQDDGLLLGYTPFYTGEPGGNYGPLKMRERCLADDFHTAATHDCQIHQEMWWTFEEFFDWNVTRFGGACRGPSWTPPWPCPAIGEFTPPPVPEATPTPVATPVPTATPPPPADPCRLRGLCMDMFGTCSPCGGGPVPTPTPQPTPQTTPAPTPTATPPPTPQPTATPRPSPPPCPTCPPAVQTERMPVSVRATINKGMSSLGRPWRTAVAEALKWLDEHPLYAPGVRTSGQLSLSLEECDRGCPAAWTAAEAKGCAP